MGRCLTGIKKYSRERERDPEMRGGSEPEGWKKGKQETVSGDVKRQGST